LTQGHRGGLGAAGEDSGFHRSTHFKHLWTKNQPSLKVFAVSNLHAAERKAAIQKADDDDIDKQQLRLFRDIPRWEAHPLHLQMVFLPAQ
jgi:hypothetical protein